MTKKKKEQLSEQSSSDQRSADYMVGQVSGSLFQKKRSAASGSLAALFTTTAAAPAASELFQPAPKPVVQSTEEKQQQNSGPEVKGQPGQKSRKKLLKEKSEAEQNLEKREIALQGADEDEQQDVKKKSKKRTASESVASNDAEHWVMKRQRLKAHKKEEEEKRKRTVFVGNLPVNCTKKMLRILFKDKGSIESIRFRSVVREDPTVSRKVAAIKRQIHPKKQSVNAYVVFKEEVDVSRAMERNGMEIEKDFHIRVDRVIDSSSHDHRRSIFVGNLSFEITELALRRHFEKCGSVEAVRLIRDQNSGLGKGFGYVLFQSDDSVQLALELDGSKLEGRSVRVKRSVKKEKPKKTASAVGGARAAGKPGRGPAHNAPGSSKEFARNRQKPPKKDSASFRGLTADPTQKAKKKALKKKKRQVRRGKAADALAT